MICLQLEQHCLGILVFLLIVHQQFDAVHGSDGD